MPIYFHTEPPLRFTLSKPDEVREWLCTVIANENAKSGEINYIFCNDEYLHKINLQYLQHDTYTDIITFDNSDEPNLIEGDIFVSTERVTENAEKYAIAFERELKRVMVHGILHLSGYKDKTTAQQKQMRAKEDFYLRQPD